MILQVVTLMLAGFFIMLVATLTIGGIRDQKAGIARRPPPPWITALVGISYAGFALSAAIGTMYSLKTRQHLDPLLIATYAIRGTSFISGIVAVVYIARERLRHDALLPGTGPERRGK